MDRDANYVAVGAFVLLVTAMAVSFVFWYTDQKDKRTYQRYEEGENRIDAPLAERIMTFTSGAVSLQDLHDQRVSWLRDNRPAVFADVREAAE